MIWLIFLAMLMVVTGLIAAPWLRNSREKTEQSQEIQTFARQLEELNSQTASGLLDENAASGLRLEIERRILASSQSESAETPASASVSLVIGTAGMVLLAAVSLYLTRGNLNIPSAPATQASAANELLTDPEMPRLIARLEARLLIDPSDTDGWFVLARTSAELGTDAAFINTLGSAFEGQIMPTELRILQGEALVRLSGGLVTPAARLAFLEALNKEPQHPGPHFYLGLRLFQNGDASGALEIWQALATRSAADAPWRRRLDAQIARAKRTLGIEDTNSGQGRGPALSAGSLEQVQDMSPEERRAFVESMVQRLRARLEENPDDYQGWLQLAQAETVMGRRVLAIDALDRAKAGAPEAEHATIDAEILRLTNLIDGGE